MDVLIIASLISAFLAGLAALFAPCCIGVLLPAYFASVFKQKRTVFLMTLVFFLGLLAVFLPLGLGVGFIGELLKEYHNLIYIVGSTFLFILGALILLGYHFSLPFSTKSQVKVTGMMSVFLLGIFSGFATLCCAPVLAGALALSLLPGSIWLGGVYSLFYVMGMVSPLFVIAYFIDQTNAMEKVAVFRKEVSYRISGRQVTLSLSNLLSGVIFILMSGIIVYFVLTGNTSSSRSSQTAVNILTAKMVDYLIPVLKETPSFVWWIVIVAALSLGGWAIAHSFRNWKKRHLGR